LPSSCPVCQAKATPSFLTSLSAIPCQPPKDSAVMGRKVMPCLLQSSSAPHTFRSQAKVPSPQPSEAQQHQQGASQHQGGGTAPPWLAPTPLPPSSCTRHPAGGCGGLFSPPPLCTTGHGMISPGVTVAEAGRTGPGHVKHHQVQAVLHRHDELSRPEVQSQGCEGCCVQPVPSMRQGEAGQPCHLPLLLLADPFKQLPSAAAGGGQPSPPSASG
jgi:hypothetical protein